MRKAVHYVVGLSLFIAGTSLLIAGSALWSSAGTSNAASTAQRGVNLAGAEFGNSLPGIAGQDYVYPTEDELDYYASKGLTIVRLPFRWERLQTCLYCPLDTAELDRIKRVVAAAGARNMQVILDPHNYARYNGQLIGSSAVPNDAFRDFWRRLAWHFRGDPAIWAYGLMNEPHDTNGLWPAAAQAGVDGIRLVDWGHTILVPGDGWSGAWTWQQFNANLSVNDPANDIIYEAHQYFDNDGSGTYDSSYDGEGAYPTIGVDRVQPFLDWLEERGARGFIGEYGVPDNDPRWLDVMEAFVNHLDANGVSSTYWAGGSWWGDYPMSVEPRNGVDRPQMSVLAAAPVASSPDAAEPVATKPAEEDPVADEPVTDTPADAPAVEGSGDTLMLYDNEFRNGFLDGSFNFTTRNACDTELAVSDPCSYAIAFTAWGGMNLMAPGYNFDTSQYASLGFKVHTGGQDLTSFSVMMTAADGNNIIREVRLGPDLVEETLGNGFVRVAVPVSQLNPNNVAIATIQIKNATDQNRNVIHVDDVELIF